MIRDVRDELSGGTTNHEITSLKFTNNLNKYLWLDKKGKKYVETRVEKLVFFVDRDVRDVQREDATLGARMNDERASLRVQCVPKTKLERRYPA